MHPLTRIAASLGIMQPTASATPPESVTPPARTTEREPLALDSVYRSVQVLQTAIIQLSADAERRGEPLPRPSILDTPQRSKSRTAFLAETVSSLALRGNAYWHIIRNNAGTPIDVRVLQPLEVATSVKDGRIIHTWRGDAIEVQHLQLLRRAGELLGLGPIQACRESVTGAQRIRSYADGWIDNGGIPNGVLSTDQDLDATTARRYKKRFRDANKGYTDGPAVLGSGLTYKPIFLTPAEVQWIEAQNFNTLAIARMFGIPQRAILAAVSGTSTTYSNAEQEDISFVRYTLMGYVREIEEALTAVLPRGQTARLNVDALLRTDTLTRYQAHKIGLDSGFLDVDDVREMEHLT